MANVAAENFDILGTWRLLSVEEFIDGKVSNPYLNGRQPNGLIHYLPGNRMAAVIAHDARTPLSKGREDSPVEELARSSATFNAYAGPFTRDGATLIHHVEVNSYENDVGSDYVRYIGVQGDDLVLSTPEFTQHGQVRQVRLVWRRVV